MTESACREPCRCRHIGNFLGHVSNAAGCPRNFGMVLGRSLHFQNFYRLHKTANLKQGKPNEWWVSRNLKSINLLYKMEVCWQGQRGHSPHLSPWPPRRKLTLPPIDRPRDRRRRFEIWPEERSWASRRLSEEGCDAMGMQASVRVYGRGGEGGDTFLLSHVHCMWEHHTTRCSRNLDWPSYDPRHS